MKIYTIEIGSTKGTEPPKPCNCLGCQLSRAVSGGYVFTRLLKDLNSASLQDRAEAVRAFEGLCQKYDGTPDPTRENIIQSLRNASAGFIQVEVVDTGRIKSSTPSVENIEKPTPGARGPAPAIKVEYDESTRCRAKISQGDLVYLTHPTPDRCGWYLKGRKVSNKKIGYFQVQGNRINQFVAAKTVDMPDWRYTGNSRLVMVVKGENVAPFIASGFSDILYVTDLRNEAIYKEIHEKQMYIQKKEEEIEVLRSNLN